MRDQPTVDLTLESLSVKNTVVVVFPFFFFFSFLGCIDSYRLFVSLFQERVSMWKDFSV